MIGTARLNMRADKVRKSGKFPIELIYSIEGQRKYINTGVNLFPENWDAENQVAIFHRSRDHKYPLNADIEGINRGFRQMVDELDNIERFLSLNGQPISSAIVVDRFKSGKKPETKKEEPSKYVFDFIDRYIAENEGVRVKGSLGVYKTLKSHLHDFQRSTKTKVAFDSIDYAFFQSFQSFLLKKRIKVGNSERGLQNTTIAKQLSTLKTFLSYARKHGISVNDNYRDFTIKREKLGVIALTENEFLALYNIDLSGDGRVTLSTDPVIKTVSYQSLAKVRDIFCFSCVTGLRYSDLMALRWANVKGDEVRITVTKTKEQLTIPLNGYAAEILGRYKGKRHPLPTISSQNFNIYVKALCKLVGIDDEVQITRFNGASRKVDVFPKYELITAHVGRKTFCTLSLEKGMSAEQVMKISGHTDYKSFQRYVNVTENIKRKAMHLAWGKPKEPIHLQKVK